MTAAAAAGRVVDCHKAADAALVLAAAMDEGMTVEEGIPAAAAAADASAVATWIVGGVAAGGSAAAVLVADTHTAAAARQSLADRLKWGETEEQRWDKGKQSVDKMRRERGKGWEKICSSDPAVPPWGTWRHKERGRGDL